MLRIAVQAKGRLNEQSMELLKEAALHTDINNLIIDEENSTVYIADPKMTLDVGAVAKGYAVEMVAKYLQEMGKTNYVVNVGGNIRTTGVKANGEKWQAGVEKGFIAFAIVSVFL